MRCRCSTEHHNIRQHVRFHRSISSDSMGGTKVRLTAEVSNTIDSGQLGRSVGRKEVQPPSEESTRRRRAARPPAARAHERSPSTPSWPPCLRLCPSDSRGRKLIGGLLPNDLLYKSLLQPTQIFQSFLQGPRPTY